MSERVTIFSRLFGGRAKVVPEVATAFPVAFVAEGQYEIALDGAVGVVFEDDGETGYLYATDGHHSEILDALHIYDRNEPDELQPAEEVFIVWNPARQRAGLYYREKFHAVCDFRLRRGTCRTGFLPPLASVAWPPVGHEWDETLC